jgi:hypothetical protein
VHDVAERHAGEARNVSVAGRFDLGAVRIFLQRQRRERLSRVGDERELLDAGVLGDDRRTDRQPTVLRRRRSLPVDRGRVVVRPVRVLGRRVQDDVRIGERLHSRRYLQRLIDVHAARRRRRAMRRRLRIRARVRRRRLLHRGLMPDGLDL